jgi:hypothetical protein
MLSGSNYSGDMTDAELDLFNGAHLRSNW